jgi:hypothetical protein
MGYLITSEEERKCDASNLELSKASDPFLSYLTKDSVVVVVAWLDYLHRQNFPWVRGPTMPRFDHC